MLIKSVFRHLENNGTEQKRTPCLNRRGFLKVATVAAAGLVTSPALARVTTVKERARSVAVYNTHTGESLKLVYWAPGEGYLHQALKELSWTLRDHYTDQSIPIDPKLLDLMHALQVKLDVKKPVHVLSGYRTPATNAMLRRHSRRVAKHSYHILGKAADIRLPGWHASDLRRAALSFHAGGVGYYRRSDFIHIDTGPVRTWKG